MKTALIIIISTVLYVAASLPGLKIDVINPDSINWQPRSYNFALALTQGNFAGTYQVYHPGITMMWLVGPVVYNIGQYFTSHGYELYSKDTFIYYDYGAKLALISIAIL